MRKVTLLLGCLLSLVTMVANAQERVKKGFPDRFPKRAQVNPPAKAPGLNDLKEKGLECFASSQKDANNEPGVIRFYSGDTYDRTKLFCMSDYDRDPMHIRTMLGGALYKDPATGETSYVGYEASNYDYPCSFPERFMKVDLATGDTVTISKSIAELKARWYMVESAYQNPVTGELWAMCRNDAYDSDTWQPLEDDFVSRIGVILTDEGEFDEYAKLDHYYSAIAFDIQGQLWAIRPYYSEYIGDDGDTYLNLEGSILTRLDVNNNFAELDSIHLVQYDSWTDSETEFPIWWNNTLSFDYATGELYGLLCKYNEYGYCYQYMYRIDTKTGRVKNPVSEDPYGAYLTDICYGLAIPSLVGEDISAPARVENLAGEAIENGTKVRLSWTNPVVSWGGDTIDAISEVRIFRNSLEGEAAGVVQDIVVGCDTSWVDETPIDGVTTYYVAAYIDGKMGVPDTWKVYAGEDTPGEVQNIQINRDGSRINLSWEAPAEGQHQGAYDAATLTYSVQRMPDSVMVAENIVETSLVDRNLPALLNYSYIITPATNKGAGEPAQSYSVMAGPAYEVPYTTEFATWGEADAWTIIDNNADWTTFYYSSWNPECVGLAFNTNSYGNSDDYAISPSVKLQAGHTYKVEYDIYFYYPDLEDQPTKHDFDITVGEGTTVDAQATVLKEVRQFANDQYYSRHKFDVQFTPEADGEYNFGLHWLTANTYDNLTLCGASIKEVVDKDMAVKSVKGATNPSYNTPADYKVTVANEGRLEASNYVVKMVRIDGENQVVLGQTEVADALAAGEETVITVTALPDMEGETQYAAVVELEGDELPANNMSAPFDVTVSPEGTVPFNAVANTNEYEADVTEMPFYFWNDYSTVQSIYYPSDFQEPLSGKATISRLAFEYRDNDGAVVTDVPVKIYLGTTDIEAYEAEADSWGSKVALDQWIPLSDQVLVYEGTFSTKLGTNLLIFDFSTPFDYDVTQNLVVTVVEESIQENKWPAIFKVYNSDGYSDIYRTLRYGSNSQQFDFETADLLTGACNARQGLPVLNLALTTQTGIENVTVGGNTAAYDAANGSIHFNGFKAAKVTVYNVAGQTVAQGNNSKLNLNSGAYVVKAVAEDGKVYTSKLQVK